MNGKRGYGVNSDKQDIVLKENNGSSTVSRRKFFVFTGMATLLALAGSILPGCFSSNTLSSSAAYAAGSSGKKPKNILIITGSAREQGNSELLAEAFAKGAREAGHTVTIFHSGQERMSGCIACDACWSTGNPCVMEDAFDMLWPLLEQADMLVFCSPLYWYNFSGHIKNAMDRLYAYSKKDKPRDLKIKEAMLLMCGETWFKKSFDGPAESYRQMLGFKGWKDRGRLFVTSVHERGEIAGSSSLKTAEKMGREA
jgi:Multimeric flavodoxin WrbA